MTDAVSYVLATCLVAIPISLLILTLFEALMRLYMLNSLLTAMPFG